MLELKPERLRFLDAASQELSICGKPIIADSSGAMFWPAERALLVADLHLEKGSAHAVRGTMMPPYDTRQTLMRLAETIDRYDPDRIIALGDSFHDVGGVDRLSEDDIEILRMMQEDREWIWITGNHDPEIGERIGGRVCAELRIAGLTLRHQPLPGGVTHEIAGHMHPAARLSMYGYSIRRPCFVGNGRRIVMPAFGAFAGGLNVLDDAFHPLFGDGGIAVWMLGQEGLYPVASRLLRQD
ncbi:MAG: ligase-associated DNA damage response endonuclease PdeM [Hyphomicrobiaceae bacterium]|nr:MAG: ligase-associated DNA damage response endonuclease PdeM [Hyphomicrobiaceae bacterium]